MSELPPRQRKVLIIDDNADAAETMCTLIELLGYSAAFEVDGAAGIVTARAMLPDVILLDIGMPLMDGFQVAEALRGTQALAGCRVVALTAWSDEATKIKAAQCGFHAHMTKPANINFLRRELELGSASS